MSGNDYGGEVHMSMNYLDMSVASVGNVGNWWAEYQR